MFDYLKTVQAMTIKFDVKIVRLLKVYIICSLFDNLAPHSRSQLRLNNELFLTCSNSDLSRDI